MDNLNHSKYPLDEQRFFSFFFPSEFHGHLEREPSLAVRKHHQTPSSDEHCDAA